ncbi:hypothetical protein V8G54_002965, partial [Vigna mungo]
SRLLFEDDGGLPHEQEASRRSGDHSLKETSEQDRRLLHSSHEVHLEGRCSWHLAQAAGGGARTTHGLRPRRLRHQHRSHRGRQGNPRNAPLHRNQRHRWHYQGRSCRCSTQLPLHQEVLIHLSDLFF